MPALGSDMDQGTLNEWLIKPGDTVTRGQVVAVVETTKAAVEVECWHEGTVGERLVPVGQTVQVGTVLATLLAPGERAAAAAPPSPAKKARRPGRRSAATVAPSAPRVAAEAGLHHRRWVSPAARRIAASLGVDVDTVTGTGLQGAVTIHESKSRQWRRRNRSRSPPRPTAQRRCVDPSRPP